MTDDPRQLDLTEVALAKRDFDILVFIVRNGKVYRTDRQQLTLSVEDNCAIEIAKRSASMAGRFVLVLEHGAIKADYCRHIPNALSALTRMTEQEYKKFKRGVDHLWKVSRDEFVSRIKRSFPL